MSSDSPLPSPSPAARRSPAASVVIPAYEVHDFIAQALDSVFAQTFTDYEVIVVNDGSPSTVALERALAPYRDRIVYVVQANAGASAARNTGVRAARGEWIAFLDGDDFWEPSFLAEQMAFLARSPGVDLVYADVHLIGEPKWEGRTLMQILPSVGAVTFESLVAGQCRVITSAVVARRTVLLEAGLFDPTVAYCEDFDLWLRMLQRGATMAYQRKVLGTRRIHPASFTADGMKLAEAVLGVLERLARRDGLTPRERAAVVEAIASVRAELSIGRGKISLSRGEIEAARLAIRDANRYRRNWKLYLTLVGLRVAPGVTRYAYQLRERMLNGRDTNGAR
jgi:glycosyltransferase involved in cell wall biosynthesis